METEGTDRDITGEGFRILGADPPNQGIVVMEMKPESGRRRQARRPNVDNLTSLLGP
ncbi:MAG: hypothetical protein U9N84_12985 [Actinomycetota bacterium]|nr:hypothetical protein [Actinomycetota bacterium]